MKYAETLNRLNGVYPYEPLILPVSETLGDHEPERHSHSECRISKGNGANVLLGPGVQILKGKNDFTASGDGCFIAIGRNTSFESSFIQVNGKNSAVVIGENCRLRGLKVVVRRENSLVFIGRETTWESGAIISESGNIVALGNDCMVSNSVVLRTSDGHTIFDKNTREPINSPEDVLIGSHVWLGNSSRVNKGTMIGSGSVLGQCAIASGKLNGSSIYAGTPARKIRDDIVWSRTPKFEDIPKEFID